jgi:S-adenosylmethionine:tRNA ribosyltransferase-isomerase
MKLDNFDFALPADRIAQRPVRPRDAAKLLVVDKRLDERRVRDLPSLLRPGDLLVLNDTRVLFARLLGQRGTVAIDATLIEREGNGCWRALARPGRRLKLGDRIDFAPDLAAQVAVKHEDGSVVLDFRCDDAAVAGALERHGAAPLPPYIRREAPDPQDRQDYQTIFAARPGAIAAPTAGLHFTDDLLAALDDAGIERTTVTLHVGAGTFLPVKTQDIEEHVMHAEQGEIGPAAAAAIAACRARGGRIVAVGTTALRLLETVADDHGLVQPWAGKTALFITPGYRFKVVDLLLTNFHLPRSTLFVLVAAFAGRARMLAAYAHAIDNGYRFYSYGDACLLCRSSAE